MKFSLKQLGIAIAILGPVCVGLFQYLQAAAPSDIMRVSFLNVGQGDAIYIRTPNGNDALIDGGPDDAVIGELSRIMPVFDRDIDLVIATHPDKDHIAGLASVFGSYDIGTYLHTEVASDASYDENLAEAATNEIGAIEILARRGQRFILDKEHGIYIDILFPDDDTTDFDETNEASVVARLVYGESSFLLTGDAYISNEQFLVRNDGKRLASDVLKLGHHGSKTSSDDAFLEIVSPQFAVVSAGKNNSYKHPAASVVERVESKGIQIVSTIDSGTITFETDGTRLWVK